MPTNASPQFYKAQGKFLSSKTTEEKLMFLDEMIRQAPKHKSSENLLANLRARRKKLEEEIEKKKKRRKSTKSDVKKGEMQAIIVGKTNSGKSSLLKILTNADPKISPIPFSTKSPVVGIMNYGSSQIQIIEIPSIEGENFDKGLVHTADTILILLNSFKELEEIRKKLPLHKGKEILILNKSDLLPCEEKRKLGAKLESKKYNFEIISCLPHIKENGINELKKKIFNSFDIIRVFTKEPGKEKEKKPIILSPGSTVKEAAEKISKSFLKRIMETKIWGPSSKFSGQVVGLSHKLKDLDVIEFKTK